MLVDLLAACGTSAMFVITPRLVGYAVDQGFGIREGDTLIGETEQVATGNWGTLGIAVLFILLVGVARGAFQYTQQYIGEKVGQLVAYDLRNDIYDRLQSLSFGYHDNAEVGQIMSRATQDVEGVRMFVSMGVVRMIYVGILVIASATLMFMLNPKVALVGLILMPLVAIQASLVTLKLRPIWMKVQNLQGVLGNVIQENLTGQRVVKAFAREDFERAKFDRAAEDLFRESYRTNKIAAFNEPLLLGYWLLSASLVFWVGAGEITAGRMTEGDMVQFQLYLAFLQQPIRMIGMVVNTWARAQSTGSRIFEIIDAESPVQERPDAAPLQPGPGAVRFEHVAFSYDNGPSVLRDINIDAAPGQVIALLGPTGSGKTSLVNLIPRFYDVTEGSITIDGEDIRDVTIDSLRGAVGLVQQDVFLFPTTIRENIRYGRPTATDEDIEEAARAARIHDFIGTLPEGYDTWVGERGTTLSGGQRQRIAIARTLLLNPRVLVFDDSTSSVDMRTEYLIQQALQNLMTGRTTFVIAQRLRTVQTADQILVLRDGEIEERGTHEELLNTGGLYRQIYDIELRAQEEAAAGLSPSRSD